MRINARVMLAVWISAMWSQAADAQELTASLVRRMDGASDGIDFQYLADGVVVSRARQFLVDVSPLVVGLLDGRAKRVGRIGEGPGEYRRPNRLSIKADSLIVMEYPRVSRFAIASFAKGTTSVEQAPSITGKSSAIIAVSSAGKFYVERPETIEESVLDKGTSETIVWRDAKMTRSRTLATYALQGGSRWVVPTLVNGERGQRVSYQPFVARSFVAPSKSGNGVALMEQRTTPMGNSALISLKVWDASGAPAGQCQWSETQYPLTDAIFDRVITSMPTSPRTKVRREDLVRTAVRPTLLPAFDLMVYASDGAIWLRTSSRHSTGVERYLRVDRTCKSRVVVKFDATVMFLDAKAGTALVSYLDDETIEARLYAYKVPPQ